MSADRSRKRRTLWCILGASSLVVLALGALAYWYVRGPANSPEEVISELLGDLHSDGFELIEEKPGTEARSFAWFQGQLTFIEGDNDGDWAFRIYGDANPPSEALGYAILWVRESKKKGQIWTIYEANIGKISGEDLVHMASIRAAGGRTPDEKGKKMAAMWRKEWQSYLQTRSLRQKGAEWNE